MLKVLVGAACVVVIAAGVHYLWGRSDTRGVSEVATDNFMRNHNIILCGKAVEDAGRRNLNAGQRIALEVRLEGCAKDGIMKLETAQYLISKIKLP